MSSVEKTIKIVKRKDRESLEDQAQCFVKTEKQSSREMAKVVTSWIEGRKGLRKERVLTKGFVFGQT